MVEEKCNLLNTCISGAVVNVKVGSRSMAILTGEIQLLYSLVNLQWSRKRRLQDQVSSTQHTLNSIF